MSRNSVMIGIVLATAVLGTFLVMSRETPIPPAQPSSSPVEQPAKAEPTRRESTTGEDRSPLIADPRAILRGRCVDENGSPLASVPVSLQGWPSTSAALEQYQREHGRIAWQDPADAISDADGRFEHRLVPPPPFRFRVTAKALGRARVYGRWSSLAPGSVTDMGDLVLARGVEVRGVLVDPDGTGLADRDVTLTAQGPMPKQAGVELRRIDSAVGRSDGFGRFALREPLLPGAYRVTVSGCTVEDPREPVTLALPSIELRIVARVKPPDDRPLIRGVVADLRGAPIAMARPEVDRAPTPYLYTDRGGRFELRRQDDMPRDAVVLGIFARGFDPWRSKEPVPWGTEDLRVVLEEGPSLLVRVVRARDRAPVERFGLEIERVREDGQRDPYEPALASPDNHPGGTLEFPRISSSRYRLAVTPDPESGLVPSAPRELVVEPRVAQDVEVGLAAFAERSVEVVSVRGDPVAGVPVELIEHQTGGVISIDMHAREPRTARINASDRVAILRDARTTDHAGRATLRGPDDAVYGVRAPGPGNVPALLYPVRFDDRAPLRVVVELGATLRGRIEPREVFLALCSRGSGAAENSSYDPAPSQRPELVLIRMVAGRTERYPPDTSIAQRFPLAADGSFVLRGISPGTWDLKLGYQVQVERNASISHTRTAARQLTLAEGEDKELVLDLRGWLPRTVVLAIAADGVPHRGRVMLEGDFGLGSDGRPESEQRYVTPDDGARVVTQLMPGTWTPYMSLGPSKGHTFLPGPSFVVGEGTAPIDLRLEFRSAQRAIRVVDAKGSPVAGLVVQASVGAQFWLACPPTDEQGRTTVSGPPGSVRLHVARGSETFELGSVDLLSGTVDPFELRLPREWGELRK